MKDANPVSMRLTGHQKPFRLTAIAHRELLSYLADARHELSDDPDGDETVRDLEVSIGDQLSALGDSAVDADQMRSTLSRVGPVVGEPGKPGPTGAVGRVPTWCRVLDGKWLTGVCLGISAATEAKVAWVRAIYVAVTLMGGALLAPFSGFVMILFFGFSVIVYLALSLLLPPVESVAEYHRHSPRRKAARR